MVLYKDSERRLVNADLFGKEAENLAVSLKQSRLSNRQLRKVYAELRALEGRIRSHEDLEEGLGLVKPYITLFLTRLRYRERQNLEAFRRIRDYLEELLRDVKSYEDFRVVVQAFEAIVAQFIGLEAEKNASRKRGRK